MFQISLCLSFLGLFGSLAYAESALPAPAATQTQATISQLEVKALSKEFKRAQASETKALEHSQAFEIRELKASQKARQKEWEAKERELLQKFLKETREGPKRRAYIKDLMERRRAMQALMLEERTRRLSEQEIRRRAVKDDQKLKSLKFQEMIKRLERPPQELWPRAGGQY